MCYNDINEKKGVMYMKRMTVFLLLVLAVLLAACGAEPVLNDGGELCFPGLRWGMTLAEAEEALKLEDHTVIKDRDHSDSGGYALIYKYYDISIPGMELFVPAQEVRLSFRGYTREAEPMLAGVTVVYAPDADLAAVQKAVEAQLGPGTPDESMPTLAWYGENRQDQYMSEGCYLREAAEHVDYGHLRLLQFPATWLCLISGAEGHDLEFYDLEEGQFALSFGTGLIEVFQHDPDASRTPDAKRTAFAGEGLLVYPGTMWSMTAEQVQIALGINGEIIDGKLTAECDFAGFKGEATFIFESWFDDLEPGLTRVEVRAAGLEAYLEETLGACSGECWSGEKTVSDFQSPVKTDWYQELTGMDPETTAASTARYDGQVLCLESPLTLAAQLNQSEKPDPYEEVKALFEKGTEDKWYQRALSCVYETPAQLDLGALFQGWIGEGFTEAELAVVLERYDEAVIGSVGQVSVSEEEMEAVLSHYFGVTLDQCDLGTFDESWMYCEETHSWLNLSMGGGYVPEFLEAETLENGDIRLTYDHSWRGLCAVTLRHNGSHWQLLSNAQLE